MSLLRLGTVLLQRARTAPPLLLFFAALLPHDVLAQCAAIDFRYSVSEGSVFRLTGSGITGGQMSEAAGYWDNCSGYGFGMPAIEVGGLSQGDDVPIGVQYHDGPSTNSSGSCGRFTPTINGQTQQITSGVIDIWRSEAGGTLCDVSDTLAHELGHAFGLADMFSSSCNGYIMGARVAGQDRIVTADECSVARERWLTEIEREDPDPNPDDHGPCGV